MDTVYGVKSQKVAILGLDVLFKKYLSFFLIPLNILLRRFVNIQLAKSYSSEDGWDCKADFLNKSNAFLGREDIQPQDVNHTSNVATFVSI